MMRSLWLVASLLLMAGSAHAAGGSEDEGGHLAKFIWQTLNLALLLGVLVYFGRKPIQSYFAERRREIRDGLDSSARLLEEAETRLTEWQGRLERLDAETEEIRNTTHRLAEAERERILADARASAERVRRDAAAAVEQEVRRARTVLREEASDLAVELAERMLRETVNEGDRDRLVDEFVERVGRAQGAGS
jgi:F-type H+-transporting ATPase subunit b